jgi:hypothetical protein
MSERASMRECHDEGPMLLPCPSLLQSVAMVHDALSLCLHFSTRHRGPDETCLSYMESIIQFSSTSVFRQDVQWNKL